MSGAMGASSSYQVPFEILRKNTSLPPLPHIKSLSGWLHKTTHGMQGIASNLLEGGFLQDDNRKAGTKKTPLERQGLLFFYVLFLKTFV